MEKQKLPNATVSLILGILSFIGCCCTSGFGGVILSGIALFLVNKDKKKYIENPELYDNYSQLNTARIIAIIGLVLSLLIVCVFIYLQVTGQYDDMQNEYMRMIEEMQENQ